MHRPGWGGHKISAVIFLARWSGGTWRENAWHPSEWLRVFQWRCRGRRMRACPASARWFGWSERRLVGTLAVCSAEQTFATGLQTGSNESKHRFRRILVAGCSNVDADSCKQGAFRCNLRQKRVRRAQSYSRRRISVQIIASKVKTQTHLLFSYNTRHRRACCNLKCNRSSIDEQLSLDA